MLQPNGSSPSSDITLKMLFAQFPAIICILEGPELRCTFHNPLFAKLYPGRELLGKSPAEMIPELKETGYFEILRQVYDTGQPFYGTSTPFVADWNSDNNPTTRHFTFVYSPYLPDGKVHGVIAFGLDVTQQVTARLEADIQQTLLNTIAQAAPTCLWICDRQMECIFVNETWINWTGKPFEEHLGAGWSLNIVEEDRLAAYQAFVLSYQTHQPYTHEYRVKCHDGSIKWCLSSGSPWYDAQGEFGGFAGSSMDITDRKEEEKRLQSVVDALPLLAWTARPTGELAYFNKRWYDYTGQTPDQSVGNGWADTMPVETKQVIFDRWQHSLTHTVPYEVEAMYRRKDGQYRWHLARAVPIKNDKGEVLYWLGTSTDIHDQKMQSDFLEGIVRERTQELVSANLELKRSNEYLKQFASAASHDLKEPLRKIQAFSDLLLIQQVKNPEGYVKKISQASARMLTLIDDLLEFATLKREPETVEAVDLTQVLEEVKQDMELLIEEKEAQITSAGLPEIRAIRHQMQQLFTNLLGNALKYSKHDEPPKVNITVEATSAAEKERFATLNKRKTYITIRFQDNGIGFQQSDAEKIFSIFQRLHSRDTYAGTGVGLALCKKVVHNHDGEIYAESQPGVGSTFSVILPLD